MTKEEEKVLEAALRWYEDRVSSGVTFFVSEKSVREMDANPKRYPAHALDRACEALLKKKR